MSVKRWTIRYYCRLTGEYSVLVEWSRLTHTSPPIGQAVSVRHICVFLNCAAWTPCDNDLS